MGENLAVAPPESEHQFSSDLGWLLSRAAHAFMTELTAALEEVGLSPRATCVLHTALDGEFTQTEIAQTADIDKTTMVVTLDQLEAEGLAERRPSEKDRRVRVIAVTAKGKRKFGEAQQIADRVRDDVLSSLPAADREVFLASLNALVADRLSEPAVCSQPVRRRAPRV
jgi:DNA-binding MarR family transcriptional regulator